MTKYFSGLEEVFENKKHLVWFNNIGEAVRLMKYYLKHSNERENITWQGRKEVIENHTWDKIIE